jgi:type IV pilus assembly protein PilO
MAITMDSIVRLPPGKKVAILVFVVVAIFGAYLYVAYVPQRKEINRLTHQRDQKLKELNESRAVTMNLEQFNREVTELEKALHKALAQLPNEREIPELLENISKVGKSSNLEFLRFRPAPERPKQFYAEVPLELVFLGTYHETGVFFDRLSKLSRIINVENFKMAPGQGSGIESILQTQAVATTFRFLEPGGQAK